MKFLTTIIFIKLIEALIMALLFITAKGGKQCMK